MKLSQAILKGCELSLPTRGQLFKGGYAGYPLQACAIGAAVLGVYGELTKVDENAVFPVLAQPAHLFGIHAYATVGGWIVWQNDGRLASREAIAARLDAAGL